MNDHDTQSVINKAVREWKIVPADVLIANTMRAIEEKGNPATILLVYSGHQLVRGNAPKIGKISLDGFEDWDNFTYLWNYACFPAPPYFLRKTYITGDHSLINKYRDVLRLEGHTVYTCSTNMEFGQ
jgi:hypothetical protein